MNLPNHSNLEQPSTPLEDDLDHPLPTQPMDAVEESSDRVTSPLNTRFLGWFGNLPQAGQLAVVTTATLAGLIVLSSALDLLSLFVKIAFLGAVAYGSYRILFAAKSVE